MFKNKSIIIFNFIVLIFIKDVQLDENRILHGFFAPKAQFPSYVRLDIKMEMWGTCGGNIISKLWVLTAAHCLKYAKFVDVYLGSIDAHENYKKIRSDELFIHPKYGAHSRRDIGLIKLKEKIEYDKFIRPIRLPKKSMTNKYLVNKICLVCGFGTYKIVKRRKITSDLLRFAVVKVISRKNCPYNSPDDIICVNATYKDTNVCYGDSGGGLILHEDQLSYIVGVASFCSRHCVGGPAGFESVRRNLHWISKITKIEIE